MLEIYYLNDLQTRYRIDLSLLLKLSENFCAKVEEEVLKIDSEQSKQFFKTLDLSLKANQLCKEANTLLGKKQYYDSLQKYEEAMNITKELGDLMTIVTCLSNIGLIMEILGDYSKALTNFNGALLLTKKIGDQLGTALQLENIGRNLKNEQRYPEALRFFRKSLCLFSQIELEKALQYMRGKVKSQISEIEKHLHQ